MAENRVREAKHLAEVGGSGNYHQIVGRRVLQDGAVSRSQQARITDVNSLGPSLAQASHPSLAFNGRRATPLHRLARLLTVIPPARTPPKAAMGFLVQSPSDTHDKLLTC
jgi:hypothetical protein